jgi:hypothetical protein
VNKVFRTALTGVISVGMFSALSVAPAQAAINRQDVVTPISLSAVGTPTVGSVLTLTKQTYNFTEARFQATWLRCNSQISLNNKANEIEALIPGTCTIISQSATTTYTVVAADAGKHITAASYISEQATGQSTNDGTSVAPSLLIAASTPTSTPTPTPTPSQTTAATPTLTAQTAPATVPATIKPKKTLKISAKSSAGLPVTVTVAGGCKVKPVVKTTKTKVGKKTVKTKTTTAYTVTMGKKKGSTCTITQANAGDATFAALNSVSTVTLK